MRLTSEEWSIISSSSEIDNDDERSTTSSNDANDNTMIQESFFQIPTLFYRTDDDETPQTSQWMDGDTANARSGTFFASGSINGAGETGHMAASPDRDCVAHAGSTDSVYAGLVGSCAGPDHAAFSDSDGPSTSSSKESDSEEYEKKDGSYRRLFVGIFLALALLSVLASGYLQSPKQTPGIFSLDRYRRAPETRLEKLTRHFRPRRRQSGVEKLYESIRRDSEKIAKELKFGEFYKSFRRDSERVARVVSSKSDEFYKTFKKDGGEFARVVSLKSGEYYKIFKKDGGKVARLVSSKSGEYYKIFKKDGGELARVVSMRSGEFYKIFRTDGERVARVVQLKSDEFYKKFRRDGEKVAKLVQLKSGEFYKTFKKDGEKFARSMPGEFQKLYNYMDNFRIVNGGRIARVAQLTSGELQKFYKDMDNGRIARSLQQKSRQFAKLFRNSTFPLMVRLRSGLGKFTSYSFESTKQWLTQLNTGRVLDSARVLAGSVRNRYKEIDLNLRSFLGMVGVRDFASLLEKTSRDTSIYLRKCVNVLSSFQERPFIKSNLERANGAVSSFVESDGVRSVLKGAKSTLEKTNGVMSPYVKSTLEKAHSVASSFVGSDGVRSVLKGAKSTLEKTNGVMSSFVGPFAKSTLEKANNVASSFVGSDGVRSVLKGAKSTLEKTNGVVSSFVGPKVMSKLERVFDVKSSLDSPSMGARLKQSRDRAIVGADRVACVANKAVKKVSNHIQGLFEDGSNTGKAIQRYPFHSLPSLRYRGHENSPSIFTTPALFEVCMDKMGEGKSEIIQSEERQNKRMNNKSEKVEGGGKSGEKRSKVKNKHARRQERKRIEHKGEKEKRRKDRIGEYEKRRERVEVY